MNTRILIGDDHTMIRKGLISLFSTHFGLTDVSEASSCNQVMRQLTKGKFTHLILDMSYQDGTVLELLPNINCLYENLQICIYSMQPREIYGRIVKQYGVDCYISKKSQDVEIICQLEKFMQNDHEYFEQFIPEVMTPFSEFTARELEILHYLIQGYAIGDIGERLNITSSTVSTAKALIHNKTGTKNMKGLIDLAMMYNIC